MITTALYLGITLSFASLTYKAIYTAYPAACLLSLATFSLTQVGYKRVTKI